MKSAHERCPYCSTPAPVYFVARDWNRWLTDAKFSYYKCQHCDLLFLRPIPADLGRYYPADYYGATAALEDIADELPIEQYKVDLLKDLVPSGRLIEIGPSRGAFAYLAKQAGFDVTAIERDAACCRFLSDVIGIRAVNEVDAAVALRAERPCDAIALWQVIEHVDEPWDVLRAAAERLRPAGVLLVATPNPDSTQFRVFRKFWAHLDAPRHLQLIPARVLKEFGQSLGLKTVFATSADDGVDRHNTFGWQQSLAIATGTRGGPLRSAIWRGMGRFSLTVADWERANLRGCTYTIAFQKPR